MMMTLRFRPVLLRSAALLAASAAVGSAVAQAPPGMVGDPFAGGSYAVPTSGPIAVAYQDSGATLSAPITDGGMYSGPTAGGPVFMAPQVIGGTMPGSPGCNCGPGGSPMMAPSMGAPMMGSPVIDGSMMGAPAMGGTMIDPSMGAPMMGPTYADPYCAPAGTGCCLTDSCLGGCFGGMCDPCAPVGPSVCDPCAPVCDPCQGAMGYGGGGLYHGAGGAQRCGWSTGFSWVFLKPFYGANEALSVTTPSGGGGFTTTGRDFDYSLDLSPRVFVEYVGRSDVGVRATWFGFESDADSIASGVPGGSFVSTPLDQNAFPGQTATANSGFDVDTIDLDLTQRLQVRRSLVNIGAGVRWAGYDHTYLATVNGPGGESQGEASRQFDGIGPTVFAEWRRPIGSSRFSLLANIRGSMLFGEAETDSVVTSPLVNSFSHQESDDFVAIGETQLGGEWSAWISRRTVMFVQVAWETQYWMGVGTALDRNDDLGLFGFNTTVGLEW